MRPVHADAVQVYVGAQFGSSSENEPSKYLTKVPGSIFPGL